MFKCASHCVLGTKLGAGHVIRMEEERVPRKVLNGKFYNTRPVEAPKARWEDAVQRDTRELLGMR